MRTHVYIQMHMYKEVAVDRHMPANICVLVLTYTYMCTHMYVYICVYTYALTLRLYICSNFTREAFSTSLWGF